MQLACKKLKLIETKKNKKKPLKVIVNAQV